MGNDQKKKLKTAIMLNALVMPGLGYIYLGQKLKGTLMAVACVFFIIAPIVKYSMAAAYTLNIVANHTGSKDFGTLIQATSDMWPQLKSLLFVSVAGIALIWLFGVVDLSIKLRNL